MRDLTPEQIAFNQSLWHWYPLGQLDAVWLLVEHLGYQTDGKHFRLVTAVLDALEQLDEAIRADRYPMPKWAKKRGAKGGKAFVVPKIPSPGEINVVAGPEYLKQRAKSARNPKNQAALGKFTKRSKRASK
jgi:hypothetical protein